MSQIVNLLRSALFLLVSSLFTIVYSSLCLLIFPLVPLRRRFVVGRQLNRFILWWFSVCCGVRYEITGLENIPHDRAGVLLANHQCAWETFYLQLAVNPLVTVLKKELLRIPFFGWFLAAARPIAIDRSQKLGALKQIVGQGVERIQDGFWVLIFPEGTRVNPGQHKKFARTGVHMAREAKAPVVPVAHNAGECWPNEGFIKKPGVIRVEFGPVIETAEQSVEEVQRQATDWIVSARARLSDVEMAAAEKSAAS